MTAGKLAGATTGFLVSSYFYGSSKSQLLSKSFIFLMIVIKNPLVF